jgi:16S rRNA (guanine527-N7)-methyltransferase
LSDTGSDQASLEGICSALRLAPSGAQLAALQRYLELLQRWNAVYNLTAVREPAQMITQHLADCLVVVTPLRRHLDGRAARVLDVGSGAGLPGLILAVMLPQLQVSCIDTVGKKVAFVQQAAVELRLQNLTALHQRVERLQAEPFDVITSRAFSSLFNLVELSGRLLGPDGAFMAMKGRPPAAELESLPAGYRTFHVEALAIPGMNAERCIVWIRRTEERVRSGHA